MWIVTKIGFFNIIQYPEDKEKDLLTVKARSHEDLKHFEELIPRHTTAEKNFPIEESDQSDYRFRLKALRDDVVCVVCFLVEEIDYRLTKPAISENFPERSGIYFAVWEDLYGIQCLKENT